jgi:uncharacterized protein (DUF362 family)
MDPNRRRVVRTLLASGGLIATAGVVVGTRFEAGGGPSAEPTAERVVRDFGVATGHTPLQLAIAQSSTDPAVLTRRAVDALGGMGMFISRGDVVAIKPNIGWDRMPSQAANTNPLVVRELVIMALDAGAQRVIVTDASCNEARRSFLRSGIWRATHEVGATVILPAEHRFSEMRLAGDVLDRWPVYKPLIEVDKLINVPVAKHHNLSRYTGAMKNWYGVLGGRRNRLHQNIDVSIADLATFMRPTLTVVDATRVLIRNGPQGGNLDDTRECNQVIASVDQVAADGYACTLIGERPDRIRYLALAEERGLGRIDYQTLRWRTT